MHMLDALISPAVGGTMMAVSAGAAVYSIKKIKNDTDDSKIPLMGVMGAFVFAAQMINFTIPVTGSSGHIGGGMLLSALLGPYAGFLTMASILLIQALFFADGGLLAYGCNLFNLGFITCFIAYPLIYKYMTRKGINRKSIFKASMVSSIIGLQLGAFSVVLETLLSDKTELTFVKFIMWMQPIHLAISIVEGLVTAAIVTFVWKARPEIVEQDVSPAVKGSFSMKKLLAVFAVAALLTGGVFSWFASTNPDGLEWSISRVTGGAGVSADSWIYRYIDGIQQKTSILRDYKLEISNNNSAGKNQTAEKAEPEDKSMDTGSIKAGTPAINSGTSAAGMAGAVMVITLAGLTGLVLNLVKKKKRLQSQVE